MKELNNFIKVFDKTRTTDIKKNVLGYVVAKIIGVKISGKKKEKDCGVKYICVER